ncbi:MAG: hypothetical protein ACKVG4_09280 [Longimicrobiales bacterium]
MRYLRNRPTRSENVRAAVVSSAIAAGVGVVTFYFARMLLAREPVRTAIAERVDLPRFGDD